MAPILRVTVSSLINKARTRSSTTTPVIQQYPKFIPNFPKTLTSSSTYTDSSLPPPPPFLGPMNLEKINTSGFPGVIDFSNQQQDSSPRKATRVYAVQGCYTYHDQQLQQKKKKMYPYNNQKDLSHDQHMVIHIVIHAVIRTTIGTFLIGYAIRSSNGILY